MTDTPTNRDEPKSLSHPTVRQARLAMIGLPHVAPLTRLVEQFRATRNLGAEVPYFDPLDGGVEARVLFVLEAPGPKAVASGFVSRDNPDESAKNWFEANRAAGIDRRMSVIWNIVPWYIGDAQAIRSATPQDIEEGKPHLERVVAALPSLKLVALVGNKAQRAEMWLRQRLPEGVLIAHVPHPSPRFVNRSPQNREALVRALQAVAAAIGPSPG